MNIVLEKEYSIEYDSNSNLRITKGQDEDLFLELLIKYISEDKFKKNNFYDYDRGN